MFELDNKTEAFLKKLSNSILTTKDVHIDILRGLRNYYNSFYNRLAFFKPFGKSSSTEILKIYTSVRIIPNEEHLKDFQPEQLLKNHKELKEKKLVHFSNTRPGIEVAREFQYLNVLGQPGAGKTTFLKYLGIKSLSVTNLGDQSHYKIPFFLELKNIDFLEDVNLYKIFENQFLKAKIPFPSVTSKNFLDQGKFLILLDGLDEVPLEKLNLVITRVIEFVNENPSNKFVTSCRTKFYKGNFHGFTDVVVTEFDKKQINNYINNWFENNYENGKNLWELLLKTSHKSTLELAQSPLLLTFICVVFEVNQDLPKLRSSLYKDALEIMLRRWAATKGIFRGEIWDGLYPELEIMMLAKISYEALLVDKIFFTEDELIKKISLYLLSEINTKNPEFIDAKSILTEIEIKQGILVQRSYNAYSFSHLTLQEYLAAYFIKEKNLVNNLVYNHLESRRWREVFILLSGLIQVDMLLFHMANKALHLVKKNETFRMIVEWIDNAIPNIIDELKLAAYKAIALYLYLFVEEKWRNPEEENINSFRYMEFVDSLYFTSFPLFKFHTGTGKEKYNCLISYEIFKNIDGRYSTSKESFHKMIKVPIELFSIPQYIKKDIMNYLRIWFLIFDCKTASLSLTKNGWRRVATRFLYVPTR